MGPAGTGEWLLCLWVPKAGCYLHDSEESSEKPDTSEEIKFRSAFEIDDVGQMRQPRVVLGLPGPGWQWRGALNQPKMAGARNGVESRSWTVESTAERARASQAGQEAKADNETSQQGKTWRSRIGGISLIIRGEMRLMGCIPWKF